MRSIGLMVLLVALAISVGYVIYEESTLERVYIMDK